MHDAVLMANVLALAAPDAYLSKTTPTHDLIQAITAVMNRPPSAPPRRAPPV
jgi:DNA-binding NarL/FixJ family response regulator